MSDTPRTDAIGPIWISPTTDENGARLTQLVNLSRQLECELAEAVKWRGVMTAIADGAQERAVGLEAALSSLLDVLTRLQASAEQMEDGAEMDARIPAAMWREFVDAHATALYASNKDNK